MRPIAIAVFSVLALAACSNTQAEAGAYAGTYIGGDDSGKLMIQMSSVKDNKIEGTFRIISVDEAGKLTARSRDLRGTVDGRLLSLNFENGDGLSLISGVQTDRGIDLTLIGDGGSQKFALVRSKPEQFAAFMDGFRKRSAELKQQIQIEASTAEQARRTLNDRNRIESFRASLANATDQIARDIGKAAGLADIYRQMAQTVNRLNSRQRQLVSDDPRADDIGYARDSIKDRAETSNTAVTSRLDELDRQRLSFAEQAAWLSGLCSTNPGLTCDEIVRALAGYDIKLAEFRDAASAARTAYQELMPSFPAT